MKTDDGSEFIVINGETFKGEWVYGAPLTKWDPYLPGISQTFIISDNPESGIAKWNPVILETIGQYTGVKGFFEDDIVQFEGKFGIIKYENGSMFVSWIKDKHEPTFALMLAEYPDMHVVANVWNTNGIISIEIE